MRKDWLNKNGIFRRSEKSVYTEGSPVRTKISLAAQSVIKRHIPPKTYEIMFCGTDGLGGGPSADRLPDTGWLRPLQDLAARPVPRRQPEAKGPLTPPLPAASRLSPSLALPQILHPCHHSSRGPHSRPGCRPLLLEPRDSFVTYLVGWGAYVFTPKLLAQPGTWRGSSVLHCHPPPLSSS